MKLLTRNTDYAARALLYIVKNKERIISVRDLVKELKIPGPFLRKILQILNKNRILKSYKGKSGGFRLAISAHKIFLVDLIEILQGPLKLHQCFFKKMLCPDRSSCLLKQKIEDIEKKVIAELKTITIASLLNHGKIS